MRLAACGVHSKVAQAILRHSDIDLTMSRYTHILIGQEDQAVESLPDFSLPGSKSEKVAATGPDGEPSDDAKEVKKKLTPQLTPTAFFGSHQLAVNDRWTNTDTD